MRHKRLLRVLVPAFFGAVFPLAAEPWAPPQESGDRSTFATGVDVVTVDVVVLDGEGAPVEGLGEQDFEVAVDGRARPIVRFEAVSVPEAAAPATAVPGAAARSGLVSTNVEEDPGRAARTFVVVFDDLHLAPDRASAAKRAVETFLKALRPGDRVTLVPSSGGAWWSGSVPADTADLVAALARLRGERPRNTAVDRISDYEAMRLHLHRDLQVGAEVARRYYEHRVLVDPACPAPPDPCDRKEQMDLAATHPVIRAKAAEVYEAALARKQKTLLALDRAAESLAGVHGRKAIVLVSEGFIEESNQPALQDATDAARRANAAFYFVDARGLAGLPATADAEIPDPTDLRDMGSQLSEATREAQGAVSLAVDTGGFAIQNTNDLARGLARLDRESRHYYLIGIEPPGGAPGSFHEIDVEVARDGARVRARRGYREPPLEPSTAASPDELDPALRAALDAPIDATGVSLRLSSSVGEASGGTAPVVLQAAVDPATISLENVSGRFEGVLETALLVSSRDTGERVHREVRADLSLPPEVLDEARRTWLPLRREVALEPGTYQAHLIVRDPRSGHVGTVRHVFTVPAPGEPAPPAVASTDIPLRARAYVFEHGGGDKARVLLVVEAEPATLTFRDVAGHSQARVGIEAEITPVGGGEPVRVRTAATIRPDREKGPSLDIAWARALTTVELPAGAYQAQVRIEDTGSSHRGTVALEIDVPPAGALRASSPVLTDTFLPAPEGQVGPPIPLARQRFEKGADLGMFFEVYGTSGGGPVEVAYRMLREDGSPVTSLPRQPLPPGPGGVPGTMIMLPLAGVPEGRYQLVLDIREGGDGKPIEVHQPFEVGGRAPATAATSAAAPAGPRRPYTALVADFLGEAHAAVVAEVAGWSVATIGETAGELGRNPGRCDATCRRAVVLLHAEASGASARSGNVAAAGRHEAVARALLDDPALEKAEGSAAFRQGVLVALGHERRARSHFSQALDLYGEALKIGDDAEARLGEGSVHESLAFGVDLERLSGPGGSRLDWVQQRAIQEAEAKRAEEAYRKALDLDPGLDEARLRLGRVLALRGRSTDARKELEAAATSADAYVSMLANVLLGQDLMEDGRPQAALERLRAAASGPSAGRVQLALCYALLRTGHAREAQESLEAALAPPAGQLDPWLGYHLGPHRGRGLEAQAESLRAGLQAPAGPQAARTSGQGGQR